MADVSQTLRVSRLPSSSLIHARLSSRNPPVSTSQALGLQLQATVPRSLTQVLGSRTQNLTLVRPVSHLPGPKISNLRQ